MGCLALAVLLAASPLVTIDVEKADVTEVLETLAKVGKVNIVPSERVGGKITMRVIKRPWDEAMLTVLIGKGLAMERVDNVIWVDTADGLRAEREARAKAREKRTSLLPMAILILPISYAKAADIQKVLEPRLTEDGSIQIDERTNTLIIQDRMDQLSRLQDLAQPR